jgi:hypothetical protein
MNGTVETPFDWTDQALADPKILVIGPKGSGKRQYLASLPYAQINWESRENTIGVVPAGAASIARMANAFYYPGEISDDRGPGIYHVFVRQRTLRQEDVLGGMRVTLADLPSLVVREAGASGLRLNGQVWHENAAVQIGDEVHPIQDHVGTAIGIMFLVDPFGAIEDNAYVADVLEAVANVYAEWREAGVSSLPTGDRRVPVAVVATKTDALHPGDPRLADVLHLHDLIGEGQADRVKGSEFLIHCAGVSAWGEGPGVRFSGTRFQPTDVLAPLREMFRNFPKLFGTHVWDISRRSE